MSTLPEPARARPVDRLLGIAAAAGAEAAVQLHIARGDDLEWRDKRGFTPLMIAAARDRAGVCRLLLRAGVDAAATDPLGRDALAIARDANSLAALEAIAACLPRQAQPTTGTPNASSPARERFKDAPADQAVGKRPPPRVETQELASEASGFEADFAVVASAPIHEPPAFYSGAPTLELVAEPDPDVQPAYRPLPTPLAEALLLDITITVADGDPSGSLFGDWEPEVAREAPPNNPALAAAEAARQQRINEHEPIDDSADWSDFFAELPEFAKPIPRADDAEFQAALRRVLLLAAREGSVPRLGIEDLLSERGDASARDHDAEAQLLIVIGDLGAEVDERQELDVGDESYALFVDPVETPAEERAVDEALAFFEDLRSGRNEPLRIYMRAVGNKALLTAAREVQLAQAMEASVERALDALSRWPAGLRRLLDMVAGAESSHNILWPIVAVGRSEADSAVELIESANGDAQAIDSQSTAPDDAGEDAAASAFPSEPVKPLADILEAFRRVAELVDLHNAHADRAALIRDQLSSLSFRRPFIARLADHALEDRGPEALEYRSAAAELVSNRDEMATANLRLVYATAKRYLYSGMPLDDLMQEGNIGLLKAVDRFDWRRGFKFSTMATWWIKQQVGRSIPDSAFAIRPPVHVYEKASKLRQAVETFEKLNGPSPTASERAAMLGVSVQKFEALARASSEPLSIEEARALGALDFDVDELEDPMDIVSDRQTAHLISKKLSELKRKPEAVVRMRSGLGVYEPMTLDQVGSALGVTRERARQIEAKVMRSLASHHARELAIATGRPIPKKIRPPLDEEMAEPDNEAKDAPTEKVADRAFSSAPPLTDAPAGDDLPAIDPAAAAPVSAAILRILDMARGMGIDVKVEAADGRARIHVADILAMDRDSRKLVRKMFNMGFTREPGKGFSR